MKGVILLPLSAKTVRNQISMLQPLLHSCSTETIRKGQNLVGELMAFKHRHHVLTHDHPFADFDAPGFCPKMNVVRA